MQIVSASVFIFLSDCHLCLNIIRCINLSLTQLLLSHSSRSTANHNENGTDSLQVQRILTVSFFLFLLAAYFLLDLFCSSRNELEFIMIFCEDVDWLLEWKCVGMSSLLMDEIHISLGVVQGNNMNIRVSAI